jgi:hypothetical protein
MSVGSELVASRGKMQPMWFVPILFMLRFRAVLNLVRYRSVDSMCRSICRQTIVGDVLTETKKGFFAASVINFKLKS